MATFPFCFCKEFSIIMNDPSDKEAMRGKQSLFLPLILIILKTTFGGN